MIDFSSLAQHGGHAAIAFLRQVNRLYKFILGHFAGDAIYQFDLCEYFRMFVSLLRVDFYFEIFKWNTHFS